MSKLRQRITRRQFLKRTAAGMALGLIGRPSFSIADEEYDLAVISGEPVAATKKALEVMGGITRFVKKGQRVVLKPNMSFSRTPDFSATTHPLVVATVAQACMEAGAQQVLVLDHTLQRAELCLERAGIREACKNISRAYVLALQERKFFVATRALARENDESPFSIIGLVLPQYCLGPRRPLSESGKSGQTILLLEPLRHRVNQCDQINRRLPYDQVPIGMPHEHLRPQKIPLRA